MPENPPAITVDFYLQIGNQTIVYNRPVVYKYSDPVKGEIYRPLEISPPVVANVAEQVYIFTSGQPQTIKVKLKSFLPNINGSVSLKVPNNFKVSEASIPITFSNKGDEAEIKFTIAHVNNLAENISDKIQVLINIGGETYNRGIKTIAYDHIPTITLYPLAEASVVSINLKITGKKIGYINGAGDKVAAALKQVGYNVAVIGENEIMNTDLASFDAIVTGVRTYNMQQRARYWQPRLMDYVKNGGLLLVQYNNPRNILVDQLGPYPLSITEERVTDETVKVDFINPQHRSLIFPNKITTKDFDGWVQERGLYFTSTSDAHYEKLFIMNDPGETLHDGSTIVANYGKGKYVYTSLSFFRQLPAGVPGAFRLFVNLISK